MGLMDLFAAKKLKALQQENIELKRLATADFRNANLQNLISTFNRSIAVYPSPQIEKYADRYCSNEDIYSIIRLLATTAARIPLYGYIQTADQKSFRQLVRQSYTIKSLRPKQYKELQLKALEDLPDTDPVAMLLDKPNDMAKYQFYVELYSWLYLDGEVLLRKSRPQDGSNAGKVMQLNFWNPVYAIPKVSETYPKQILAWDYEVNGIRLEENVPASEVIHIKYWNPESVLTGDELRGLSPIRVLHRILTRGDSNMNRTVAHLQNSGVETMVFDKSLIGDSKAEEIIGQRKDNFYRFISNSVNAGSPYLGVGEWGSINIGSHLNEMGVTDLAKIDFKKLCNAYGVSDRLFNNDATGSEISDDNARKGLYTIGILPNVFMVRDAFINHLLPDFQLGTVIESSDSVVRVRGDGKARFIDADLSDVTELQEDIGKQVAALSQAHWLTPNEKRDVMNYERYEDPLFDEPLIPTGFVPLSDLNLPEPELPLITPNGN